MTRTSELTTARGAPPEKAEATAAPVRKSAPPPARTGLRARLRRDRMLLLFVLPGLLLLLGFHYLPLAGNVIAFKNYLPFLGIGGSEWIGFDNFKIIFNGDPAFLNALEHTLLLTLIQAVVVFPIPILLAITLNSLLSQKAKAFVQSVLLLPHFLSWVIVVALFQEILGGSGAVNHAIRELGGSGVNFLSNPDTFFGVIAAQAIWKDTGWAMILFLAALSQIDTQLYEASSVDGASRMRQLWHVTLPGLRGVIILLFILKLGDSLSLGFEQIILQQNLVGRDASEVLDTYVYNNGVVNGQWGVAAAVGLIKGIVSVGLVLAANKVAHIFGEGGVYQR
ncbi:ABC transporter permease [Streptomyces aculeolatus]